MITNEQWKQIEGFTRYGDYLIAAVKEFQKRTGLTADGYFGEKTLKKLESFGFKK